MNSGISILALGAALLSGCSLSPRPGVADVPPLQPNEPRVYTDINPRWSHDGEHIAFLRATPDRRLQLFLTIGDLDQASALLEPELVSPDRPYDPSLRRYSSPDTLAWSPDDRRLAFARVEWFQFDDGQRLPGTGIWAFDLRSGRVSALALHPKRYNDLYYYYHSPAWSPDGSYVAFVAEGTNGQRSLAMRCLGAEMPKEVAPRFDNYAASDWPAWRATTYRAAPRAKESGPNRPMGPTGRIGQTGPIARSSQTGAPLERPVLAYCQAIFRTQNIRTTASLRALQPGSADQTWCRELGRISPGQYEATSAVRSRSGPRDVVEPRASHLAWSPDGRRIAYTLSPDANDFPRYETWVLDTEAGETRRVSPLDGRGYFAPVWIDGTRLGALSPHDDRFDVVTLNIARGVAHRIGAIDTADCDWSPDRSRIVYASSPPGRANSPDDPTTLRILKTHLSLRQASLH